MKHDLRDLPDGKIISLMAGPKHLVSKELRDAAALEWTRRVNKQNLEAALERQKEIG